MRVIFRQDGFPSGEPNFLIRLATNERVEKVARIVLKVLVAVGFISVFVFVVIPLAVENHRWDQISDWGVRMFR